MSIPAPDSLSTFLDADARLVRIPVKYAKKLELAHWAIEAFEYSIEYNEKQVNELLLQFLDDFAFLRRFLVGLGLLERDNYGHRYTRVSQVKKAV